MQVRTQNLQDILGVVADAKRQEANLILLGLESAGQLNLTTPGAATAVIEHFGRQRPDWFQRPPAFAGVAGGTPGVGLPPQGSVLALPPEQIASLTPEQLMAARAMGGGAVPNRI